MAVDAVLSEAVFGQISLLTGNLTGKKKFSSGKEIIKTGKRSNRIGKFISVKIYDDFKNKLISLVGYYSQLTDI